MKPLIVVPVLLAGTITIATFACRSTGGLGSAIKHSQELAQDTTQATVAVQNQGYPDVDVFVIPESGGPRRRLGTALGNTTTTLPIPKDVVLRGANLRFLIDPIGGGRTSTSQRIFVVPGDEVDLTIPPA